MLAVRHLDFESGTIGTDLTFDEVGGAGIAEVAMVCDLLEGRIVLAVCSHVFMDLIHRLKIWG